MLFWKEGGMVSNKAYYASGSRRELPVLSRVRRNDESLGQRLVIDIIFGISSKF